MAARWQQWMPFHIDRFRGSPDVQAMHPAARWGYLSLLASAWQSEDCTLSSDPIDLASASGLGDELWKQYGPRILKKFRSDGHGHLKNYVLEEEWLEAKRIFEARVSAAKSTNASRSPHAHRTVTDGIAPRSADTITGTYTNTETKKSTKTLAESDKKPVATPLEETVFDLPCTSGQTYRLPESLYASMVKAYPGISVMSELEKARVWLLANRTQMKTVKGVPRFLNSWMSRAQNNCKPNGGTNGHYQAESKYQRAEREALEIVAREEADAVKHGATSQRLWGDA